MRLNMRMKSLRSRYSANVKKLVRATRTMSTRTVLIAVIGVTAAVVLIGAVTLDVHQDQAPAHAAVKTSGAAAEAGTTGAGAATKDPQQNSVTITGCLERDAETFRLKDTAGDNAPKARSWKSGFLKKGSASVALVDTTNSTRLSSHIGQRVSVTGTLVDREMHVRSLQRVASSCGAKS